MSKILYALMLIVFTVSLFPRGNVTISNDQPDLGKLIQSMQTLQQTSSQEKSDFKNSFQKTINTLQGLAGLQLMTLEKKSTSKDEQSLIIVVSYRLTYLPTSNFEITKPLLNQTLYFMNNSLKYDSHISSPETPPPVFT